MFLFGDGVVWDENLRGSFSNGQGQDLHLWKFTLLQVKNAGRNSTGQRSWKNQLSIVVPCLNASPRQMLHQIRAALEYTSCLISETSKHMVLPSTSSLFMFVTYITKLGVGN